MSEEVKDVLSVISVMGAIALGISLIVLAGTYAGYLTDKHVQAMADKGYEQVKTVHCTEYKTVSEFKLRGE